MSKKLEIGTRVRAKVWARVWSGDEVKPSGTVTEIVEPGTWHNGGPVRTIHRVMWDAWHERNEQAPGYPKLGPMSCYAEDLEVMDDE